MKALKLSIILIAYFKFSNSFHHGSIPSKHPKPINEVHISFKEDLHHRTTTTLNSAVTVSLDRSLLPSNKLSFNKFSLLIIFVIGMMSIYSFVKNDEFEELNSINFIAESFANIWSINKMIFSVDLLAPFKYVINVISENIKNRFKPKRVKSFSLEIWNVCKLTKIENLSEDYSKYRFDLQSYPGNILSLDIGQQVYIIV